MGDLIGGGTDLSGGLTSQFSFELIFNLIWKLLFAIVQKAGLYDELAQYGVDLTKYINTDVSIFN